LFLLALPLAGCATRSRPNAARVPDWETDDAPLTMVVPPPNLAPPPLAAPSLASFSVQPLATPAPGRLAGDSSRQFGETWIALNRWCKANGLDAPTRVSGAPSPSYALRSAEGTFLLSPGSQTAHWDGLELRLGFAPQMIDAQPFVHALDLKKTVQPLLAGIRPGCLSGNPIIVIDPGHGGENTGTRSVLGKKYEKEFTLDWAARLERLLSTNGWRVLLTRSNDSNPALSNRVAFAEEHEAGLFLSLHFNSAAPDESQSGLETYCLTPAGMPSTVTRGFADDPALSFPNNAFDAQNLQLACLVHRSLLQVSGIRDRGVRRARFPGVLRGQQRPAILIEGGYLSNPREARLISDPAYRQKLAEAVARALGQP